MEKVGRDSKECGEGMGEEEQDETLVPCNHIKKHRRNCKKYGAEEQNKVDNEGDQLMLSVAENITWNSTLPNSRKHKNPS